jgi:hypothetical protein
MSNRAHAGRCFRAKRETTERKRRQEARKLRDGVAFVAYEPHPIRWKVPLALKPFLTGNANQNRARMEQFGTAIVRYNQFRAMTGKGARIKAAPSGDVVQNSPRAG